MADQLYGNPAKAPEYNQHREVLTVDLAADTVRAHGMNMASHRWAHIQVVPEDGADPTVHVMWWSEAAGKFIQDRNPLAYSGVGADTPFEITVECLGRIMFVMVPTLASGNVNIFVSGAGVEHR